MDVAETSGGEEGGELPRDPGIHSGVLGTGGDDAARESSIGVGNDVGVVVAVEDAHASSGAHDADQLGDGPLGVRDMDEGGDGKGDVELGVGEREGAGVTRAQLDQIADAFVVGEAPGDFEQGGTEVGSNRLAGRGDPSRDVAEHDATTAADLEHPLAG